MGSKAGNDKENGMRKDNDLHSDETWLDVANDPMIRRLALLAGLVLCLGVALIAAGVRL